MPQYVPGSISPDCYDGSYTSPHSGFPNPSSPDTSTPMDANFSSAAQIGQRLAAIGDEFNRTYEKGFENKMAHAIRQSIRIVGNCQNFALSLLRSVKNIASRVDHGANRIPGRRTLVSTRDPVAVYPNLLLLAALVAVFGLVIKLGLDD
ncbi:uncharacterized protein RB166_009490 isoform 1-T2 [Leptodactylus fuscus]